MQSKQTTDLAGVDISSLQSITNETTLFSKINFLYCRAYGSDHTGTGDSAFNGFVTTAHNHKCPVGAYYFATPFVDANNSTDAQLTTQAQGQAQQFIDKLQQAFGTGNYGDLVPFMDLETYTDKNANQGHTPTQNAWYPQSVMTSAQFVTWVKAFRDYFFAQTGRRVGIYWNAYWATTTDVDSGGNKQGMGLTNAQIADINNNNTVPLWLAQYDQYANATTIVTPPDLSNMTHWDAWQYSGTGVASDYGLYHSANQVDLDRCTDLSYLQLPPLIQNWGVTDNQDGTVTVTMTHPTTVDYIGTSLYQDDKWIKWIAKGTTSVNVTGLTQGQTYNFKLVSEDNNHDFTSTAENTITLYAPPPPPTTTADPNATPDPTTTTTTTGTQQTPVTPTSVVATPQVYGTIDVTLYPTLQQSRYFTFNNLDSRNFGFLINDIKRPYFPPLQITTIGVPNRAGALAVQRNEWGVRNITIDITLMGNDNVDLRQKVRNLAGFLVYYQEVPLIFSDEPNLQYYARFNQNQTNLDELAQTGAGTLVFTCFDPLAYSTTEQTQLLDTQTAGVFAHTIHNAGTAQCFPRLEATPTADCTFIKFTNLTTNKSITYNATWTAGDKLMIDCRNNLVYRESDNISFLENITLDSEFFALVAGDNAIQVSNQDDTAGAGLANSCRVYWTEAYY